MDLLKTIEEDQQVTDYSENSDDEAKDIQPIKVKRNKKVSKDGGETKVLSKDFDNDFKFFTGAKGETTDYLADSWRHVSEYIKKKSSVDQILLLLNRISDRIFEQHVSF